MRARSPQPVGVVLAGGLERRIGGSKALAQLRGRPLISYPMAAMRAAVGEVAIVAKADTELPSLPGAWVEPEQPRHPIMGIIHALALAEVRAVLVCAADLPFVTGELLGALARADPAGAGAVLASGGGRMQPLFGCYQPWAGGLLAPAAAHDLGRPLRELVSALAPGRLEVEDPDVLFDVNSPADLITAAAMIERGALG